MKKILFTIIALLFATQVWATSCSSTFAGGNEDPLSEGGNWSAALFTASLKLVSNAVQGTDIGPGNNESIKYYVGCAATNDHWSQVTISALTGADEANVGATVRTTATPTYYACVGQHNSGGGATSQLYYNNAGSYGFLADESSTTWVATDAIYCEASGTNLILKRNAVSLLTTSDATISTGQPGIYISGTSNDTDQSLDNFSGGDLGGGVVTGALRRRNQ